MSRQRIKNIKQEISALETELRENEKNLFVKCKGRYSEGCGRGMIVKNLILFRSEWYTPTHG